MTSKLVPKNSRKCRVLDDAAPAGLDTRFLVVLLVVVVVEAEVVLNYCGGHGVSGGGGGRGGGRVLCLLCDVVFAGCGQLWRGGVVR